MNITRKLLLLSSILLTCLLTGCGPALTLIQMVPTDEETSVAKPSAKCTKMQKTFEERGWDEKTVQRNMKNRGCGRQYVAKN